jgi:ubiquitin-protein ligase
LVLRNQMCTPPYGRPLVYPRKGKFWWARQGQDLPKPSSSLHLPPMDAEDNNTDYDRESGGVQSEGEDEYNSQYSFNDEDEGDRYEYDDDDGGAGQTFLTTYVGMQYEGNMNEMMKEPGKSSLYPVYKQLSEICLVDINANFFSATLTIGVKDQTIMASITFPNMVPFFPDAPPKLELHSKFRYPNEKYNILFNCHPQLLSTQWNFCTDIVQIIRDLIHTAETSVVDTFDDDFHSGLGVQRMITKMLQQNSLDVTSIFPDSQKNKLPSFGIIRDPVATAAPTSTRPKGVGYSGGSYSTSDAESATKWNVSAHTSAKLDGLLDLTKNVQADIVAAEARGSKVDPILIDAVYFIFSHTISRTITMEEFFRNLAFYDLVLESLLPLPPPSEHIAPIQSLLKLYEAIMNGRLSASLEPNEKEVLGKLRILYDRLQKLSDGPRSASRPGSSSSSSGAKGVAPTEETAHVDMRAGSASSSKKRQLSPSETAQAKGSVKGALISVEEIPRVIELEDAFASHKYASDQRGVSHMNAKWLRRVHMELGSMPESLPDNVVVFSGMQCSQPNLMKILMFPESPDTPYCGGCFLFDAFLPSDYPANPPKVNLITTGTLL